MQRIIRIGLVVLAMLGVTAPLAQAQKTVAIGKNGEVQFGVETRVGSTLLKPGHYQFQHRLVDGQHYLVIRERVPVPTGAGIHVVGGGGGRELARVPCRVVTASAGAKTLETRFYRQQDPDGVKRIMRIDIAGEREGHIITIEPSS